MTIKTMDRRLTAAILLLEAEVVCQLDRTMKVSLCNMVNNTVNFLSLSNTDLKERKICPELRAFRIRESKNEDLTLIGTKNLFRIEERTCLGRIRIGERVDCNYKILDRPRDDYRNDAPQPGRGNFSQRGGLLNFSTLLQSTPYLKYPLGVYKSVS
jgi:hypothetical protein